MKVKSITDINDYYSLIQSYSKKGTVSNNYLLPDEVQALLLQGKLSEYHGGSNCYIFVEKPRVVMRLYYLLNDFSSAPDLDCNSPIVTEILFRGDEEKISEEMRFLENAGFRVNLRRDQYSVSVTSSNDIVNPEYVHCIRDGETAVGIINAAFDIFSGDYVPLSEVRTLVDNKSLLCVYNDAGEIMGVLHMTLSGKIAWVSHLVVNQKFRGKGVARKLMDMFVSVAVKNGMKRLMLWVQNKNEKAISLYKSYGFKYTNKSTISLIKENGRII